MSGEGGLLMRRVLLFGVLVVLALPNTGCCMLQGFWH